MRITVLTGGGSPPNLHPTMDKKAAIQWLKQQVAEAEAELAKYQPWISELTKRRDILLMAIQTVESGKGPGVNLQADTAPPPSSAGVEMTVADMIFEVADSVQNTFTKSDVEKYAREKYPGFLEKYEQRAVPNTLQKLAIKRKIERVSVGLNGAPSVYKRLMRKN